MIFKKGYWGGASADTSFPIYVTRKNTSGETGTLSMPLMQTLLFMLFAFLVAWVWLVVALIYAFVVLWRLIF